MRRKNMLLVVGNCHIQIETVESYVIIIRDASGDRWGDYD